MTLRARLFLIIGGLAALLVLAQWWWTRKLTRELSDEIDAVASSVGHSVASFFAAGGTHAGIAAGDCEGEGCDERIVALGETILREELVGEDLVLGDLARGDLVREDLVREDLVWTSKDSEEDQDGETRKTHHRMVRVFSNSMRIDGEEEPAGVWHSRHGPSTAHRIVELDSSTGDVEIVGGFEARGEQKQNVFVKLHIEHEGEERYLWMDGPRHLTRRFEIPQQGIREELDGFSRKLLLASLGILAVGLVLAGAAADRVSAPLRRLAGAARQVGDGALGTRVPEPASGEVGQAIASFNRMSERLAELEAQNRELDARQHLGEIGEIARGLAHSLRNPLNALGLSVEELAAKKALASADRDGHEDAETSDLAVSARRQIQRIDRNIRSFLALASQGGDHAEDVDLAELAEDVALEALQGVRPPGGRVKVRTEAEPGLATLRAVEPELRAVVQALVVNAVEASPEGGEVTVRLTGAPEDGRVRLEVADRGPGLPDEVRSRLFTPHLSTKASGSGMGLFLAHRIATNRYGGRLELEDREGGGTRAVLELSGRIEPTAGGQDR